MKIELCAYKKLRMYNDCEDCNGRDINKMCYITKNELTLHLQQFQEVMFLDRFEPSELEEQFETHGVFE